MKTLRELYRIGNGPSSSHTMAPARAAAHFFTRHSDAASFRVTLFDSLAATGKGHLTDAAIENVFGDKPIAIRWKPAEQLPLHPNGLRFEALDANGNVSSTIEDYSTGGGALLSDGDSDDLYTARSLMEILRDCEETGRGYWEYVGQVEDGAIWECLGGIWSAMRQTIKRGLEAEGRLPGGLGISRKARSFQRRSAMLNLGFKRDVLLAAYAYAVSEENACGGQVVTAPTCGSSGVLPAVLLFLQERLECTETDIIRALATAGLFGNIVKTNGSISGARVGCQGEVGTACAMAAAAAAQLMGGSPRQIEYAAEMGLEHHLGLTCDPVAGLVQIPCIERNAHAATRALSCSQFALLSDGQHRVSFDDVVSVMLESGSALPSLYRETSGGGLARLNM